MKLNARLLLAACACGSFALFAPVLHAQDDDSITPGTGQEQGPRAGEGRVAILEKVAKALGLTDEQKADIKSIVEQRRAKVMAVRENKSLSPEQKREQVKEILQSSFQQIKGILTPDQQQKLEQIIQRVKERREGNQQQQGSSQ